MLAGPCTYREQRTQIFIQQIPFLFETVKSAGWFFLGSLFEGEQVFVGEFLRGP